MGTLVKNKVIYSGSPQYYEMPNPSEDLLDTIVQFVGTSNANYTNGYFYKCVEVVPATDPKTYKWERCDVQPNGSIDAYTKTETDALLDEKASLSIAEISTAGGGREVHTTLSQGEDEVSVNYYKTTELPDTLNLNIGSDSFRLPTAGYVDSKVDDVAGAVPFIANYGQTTYADVTAAIDSDKAIVVNFSNNKNLICVTYATYTVGQNVTMSGVYKADSDVSLVTITLTPENVWSIAHTEMQEKLVAGTNIKTVNSKSLVGNGNIDLEKKLTKAEYDALTEAEKNNGTIYFITDAGGGGGGSYVLPIASRTTLGGVKIGNNLSISSDGTLSASGGGGGTTDIPNENLLDNPWFTINQRDLPRSETFVNFSPLESNLYLDRWSWIGVETGKYLYKTDNTLGLYPRNIGYDKGLGISQYLRPQLDEEMDGKKITLSVLTKFGQLHQGTITREKGTNQSFFVKAGGSSGYSIEGAIKNNSVVIYTYGVDLTTYSVQLTAAKLEYGESSTLTKDAPPDYASELQKCQLYFRRIEVTNDSPLSAFFKKERQIETLMESPHYPLYMIGNYQGGTSSKTITLTLVDQTGATENVDVNAYCRNGSLVYDIRPSVVPFMGVVYNKTGNTINIDLGSDY